MEMISMLLIALVVAALSIAMARLGLSLTLSLASQATIPSVGSDQSQISSQGDISAP